jgi:hypothetical protein
VRYLISAGGVGALLLGGLDRRVWLRWLLAEIAQCRGADHRRRFALQLCTLRAYGRFLDDYRQAPLKIVSHLSRQLDLPPVLFLNPPGRGQTERAQSLRIRRYLGLHSFDRAVAADLREWLRKGALEGRSTAELLSRAEDKLREWRVMLPAVSTLERIAVAEVTYATTNLFDVVTSRLPVVTGASIDLLVEVPEGDARSSPFRLKDYPKSSNAAVVKSDIVRLRLIEELLGTVANWMSSIPRSYASSASSGAATMPAISDASPSPSVSHSWPATW